MMNINEYLENLFNTQGYEAWEEENENLWNMYNTLTEEEVLTCAESSVFTNYCASKGINLEARRNNGVLEVCYWMWNNEE